MSLILSIETGTDICSVALSKNDELISLRESEEGRSHAGNLAVFIKEILSENRMTTADLDAIAVGMGPGSYTGLRIGVSLAKGICYGSQKPLIAVSSLTALSHVAQEDAQAGLLGIEIDSNTLLCPMIDARRMEVYTQLFDNQTNPLSDVSAMIIRQDSFYEYAKVGRFMIFGNGAEKCREVIALPNLFYCHVAPSARGLVRPAYDLFLKKEFQDVAYFEPFYLKDFVAGISKKNPLKPM